MTFASPIAAADSSGSSAAAIDMPRLTGSVYSVCALAMAVTAPSGREGRVDPVHERADLGHAAGDERWEEIPEHRPTPAFRPAGRTPGRRSTDGS